jgi:hypothetical protein
MESTRFDALSRSLGKAGTRRRLLGFLTSLPLAANLPGVETETATAAGGRKAKRRQERDASGERNGKRGGCIATGKRCPARKPKGKKGKRRTCKDCCQGSFTTNSSGAKICACQPEGTACTADTASNCCSGVCTGGTCQATNGCAAECNGCCDESGACQAGRSAEVCGTGGATCAACSGNTPRCKQGVCSACTNLNQCPANSVCAESGACLACDVCASGCDFTSIQEAIDGRPDQDVFAICRGTYTGNLTLERDVELIGARDGFSMLTIVRGDGTASVITIPDTGQDVTLRQMQVTGGAAVSGGGILHEGKALTLVDVAIIENRAGITGAGLSAPGDSPTRTVDMTRCTIFNNSASAPGVDGGGVFNGASMNMRDCEITFNSASSRGGGIFNEGSLTLHSTAVGPQNGTGTLSGGIYNSGTLELFASKVGPENYRGGIENAAPGTVSLDEDSTVCGNFGSMQCTGFDDPGCVATCPS